MQLTNLFYRSPRLLALTLLLILTAGSSALMVLPRAEDPTLSQRNATVFTTLAGADAERVEALITEVLEDTLGKLARQGSLMRYPPLVEKEGVMVAQTEHTMFLGPDGVEVLTA